MTLEDRIRKAVQIAALTCPRIRLGPTESAIVDRDADGDGRKDANPDKGAGSESGTLTVLIGAEKVAEGAFPDAPVRALTSKMIDEARRQCLDIHLAPIVALEIAAIVDESGVDVLTVEREGVTTVAIGRGPTVTIEDLNKSRTASDIRSFLDVS